MRLLHVKTLDIHEFAVDSIPNYAILSHTWADEEISYEDILNPRVAMKKKGFSKVKQSCLKAKADGLTYIWIDT
jgi:hypothetical protein